MVRLFVALKYFGRFDKKSDFHFSVYPTGFFEGRNGFRLLSTEFTENSHISNEKTLKKGDLERKTQVVLHRFLQNFFGVFL